MDFTEFNLHNNLQSGIENAGYVKCTQVQEQVLKYSVDGSDLYVQSQTGTGKTAAYLVSILQAILSNENNKGKQVLILLPTRELAVQVENEANTLIKYTTLKAFSFYGGVGYDKQVSAIKKDVDIIIGTPGRVIDLQQSGELNLSNVGFLVIDEADRMFDMGFYPDLRKLLKILPKTNERQTMLFSATLNSYVKNLAWEYTNDAKEITIESENITVDQIAQELLHVSSDDKMKLLVGILSKENATSTIIFCNTKRSCEVISKRLNINGFKSEFIIGDLPQSRRLKVLNSFKERKISILVATDVAARGIDVEDLEIVVNYDLPNEAENYVHRIGRTARAGKSGKAYTFCSEQDVYNLPAIERYIEMQIPSQVADNSILKEDKSEGIYIKTENWKEDTDNFSSKYSNNKNYRTSKRSTSNKKHKNNFNKKSVNYNKNKYIKEESTIENIEELEKMSFEQRMQFYKTKYAPSKNSDVSYQKQNKKENTHKKSKKTNKSFDHKKKHKAKFSKATFDNMQKKANSNKGLQSRSLWSKLKSLFSKK